MFPPSATTGVYVGVKVVAFVNMPPPLCVHKIPAMFVALAPLTVNGVVTQVSPVCVPASSVGESVTFRDSVSIATTQLPLPVTVMVKITTLPPSAATGVYVGVSVVAPDVID